MKRVGGTGVRWVAVTLALAWLPSGCADRRASSSLASEGPVHLARVVERATVEAAESPAFEDRHWSFSEGLGEWRPLAFDHTAWLAAVAAEPVGDGVRVSLARPPQPRAMLLIGGLHVELEPALRLGDWEAVKIRARSSQRFAGLTLAHNLSAEGAVPTSRLFFFSPDQAPPVFNDGSEQTYAIALHPRDDETPDSPLASLAVLAASVDPAALDILSIELVPRGARYAEDSGVVHVARDGESRATLYAHAPARVGYDLKLPRGARLDLGLTVEPGDAVHYRVVASEAGGEDRVLFDETVTQAGSWGQRSVDLSSLSGQRAQLTLEATSERPGAVALWGAPVLSGSGRVERPNVIFYVIDGGGSDLMSVYGYERPTTPFLEKLAAEAVLFERAHSNSTWTQPSTVSFMTSLHHSVLGGLRRGIHSTPVPTAATTMAEHFSAVGYQTASFTANPNAGRLIGLERGVDVLRDGEVSHHSSSSEDLHRAFWELRDRYPGGPWWVHFQTTDVHEPNHPEPPFAGRLVSEAEEERLRGWDQQIFQTSGALFGRTSIEDFYNTALASTGIDRRAYFDTRRGLYDETMMHQDRELAELVEALRARGLWESTLLVIASDHGHPAGSFARFGRGLIDPRPEPWEGALFDAYASRVPLLFIWPGHIEGGRRFAEPVSMIDVLPTVLDLVGLPQPEVLQGQSVAPLLTGGEQKIRPVILDEFRVDDATGEMIGNLEIIDGRWGASLEIGPRPGDAPADRGRHAAPIGGRWGAVHPYFPDARRLLLYDLENDPFATSAVNDEHPELVERYRALLRRQWRAHQALSQRFEEAGEADLSPEQLQQLRSLGYIQ